MRVTFAYLDGLLAQYAYCVRLLGGSQSLQSPKPTVASDVNLGLGCLRSFAAADPEIAAKVEMTNRGFRTSEKAEAIADSLLSAAPDLIALSCFVWNREKLYRVCRAVRRRNAKVILVVGGPEVPWEPKLLAEYLKRRPYLDAAIPGEGEPAFADVLRARLKGLPLHTVTGLAARRAGRVVASPPRPFLERMDDIPSPYLSGHMDVPAGKGLVAIETSRGCPLTCSFCDYHVGRHAVRDFWVDRLSGELEYLKRKGFTGTIFIIDPLLNIKQERFKKVLDILRAWPYKTQFVLHPEMFDEESIAKVGALAAPDLAIGIQSINEPVMKNINRRFHIDRITENIGKLLRFPNVMVMLDLIIGLPGDDLNGFKQTLDWALSFERLPYVHAFDLWMSPNAPLFATTETYGVRWDKQGIVRSTHSFGDQDLLRARRINNALLRLQSSEDTKGKFMGLLRTGRVTPSDALERLAAGLTAASAA